jgi:vacuolar-type H+-ATPase subunit I/STV1
MIEKFKEKMKLGAENILFYSIVFGVLLLSAGVYIMGSGINRPVGSYMIILGSGIFYVSVIIFALRLK